MSDTSEKVKQRHPIVWVINEGGHDFSDAERFGRLMPITTGSINPFNVDRLMVLIAPRLQMAHEDDFLLISGPQILNAVVLAMWLQRFPHANVLQWSIRRTQYVPLLVSAKAVERNATAGV